MDEPIRNKTGLFFGREAGFWRESRALLGLALPIIVGQVLQNALSVIDVLMVGRVSVAAVAAASLASALFVVPLVFGFGVLGPFSVLVAGAAARGSTTETIHHLRRGLNVALVLGMLLAVVITVLSGFIGCLHQPPAILAQARPFLLLLTWSLVPMYLFQILKQYCEALHTAWPPMVILVLGVAINSSLNWIFIFGHLHFPALGLLGAGWATCTTRLLMLAMMSVVVLRIHFPVASLRRELRHGAFHWAGYRQLLNLGVPAGVQVILEVGAFTFTAIMMGWISETALAAHQVAISVVSTTFMVALGISMAISIRVSHAIGSNNFALARQSIRAALFVTGALMVTMAGVICLNGRTLAGWFVHDPRVMAVAAQILFIGGLFQIFDGLQVVCAGSLRGLHDIKVPTLINLCGYWLVGLPLAYWLGFRMHLGPSGIWWGMLTGLALLAGLLLTRLKFILSRFKTEREKQVGPRARQELAV
jgi:MATE family multidrug resistance protein